MFFLKNDVTFELQPTTCSKEIVMQEHAVMAIMEDFQKKYLKNESLMGFSVLDEGLGVLIAATLDHAYGDALTNPVKSWLIFEGAVGFEAVELKSKDDFQRIVLGLNKPSLAA